MILAGPCASLEFGELSPNLVTHDYASTALTSHRHRTHGDQCLEKIFHSTLYFCLDDIGRLPDDYRAS